MKKPIQVALAVLLFLPLAVARPLLASGTRPTHVATHKTHVRGHVQESSRTRKSLARIRGGSSRVATVSARGGRGVRLTAYRGRHHRSYERFTGNSFSENVTEGDISAGEDPVVRQAAIEALDGMNGTVVAIDPDSGRILAMVNQKLALSSGAEPCSTIKISVALAALEEHVVTKDTPVAIGRNASVDMTEALAHSNNAYFEALGRRLGFERVKHYANEFGLGELAGYNISGEQLGTYPDREIPAREGGVGKMCSFGEGVSMTPLQLGALVASIANGGTLYYLQHPTTPEEILAFEPKVKRTLDIKPLIPEIADGMEGAVDYGTARSLRTNFSEIPVLGKTGTCSSNGTRYGWFASFANTTHGRIVTVIFLEGGRPTFGPKAAELTGHFYRGLYDHSYFLAKQSAVDTSPAAIQGVSQ